MRGRAAMPGSKSHTIRAVTLASLAEGQSSITAPLVSADTMAAVRCYRGLGANIDCTDNSVWKVTGTGGKLQAPENIIDVANSGTTLRLAVVSAALLERNEGAVFTGDSQIRKRPLDELIKSINGLGGSCFSTRNNGKTPVVVCGKLNGGTVSIEAVTSQYLSALLLNTPLSQGDTVINVTKLNEKPYVQMTLDYLDRQNIRYENDDFKQFRVVGGQSYKGFDMAVPADFSSATFFLCAGAILDADITLTGLDFDDAQGDKAVVNVLKKMGADIQINANELTVRGGQLSGVDVDMNDIPDALPALAVTACFAKGTTRLYNVAQARLKETDRIAVMAQELGKMGANVQEMPDGLVIKQSDLQGEKLLNGHDDHRVVMALSLAGMVTEGETVIKGAEAINITFPNYIELMQRLGAKINMTKLFL